MSRRYKHLLFDLDHTIWDFDRNSQYVIYTLFEDFNLQKKVQADAVDFYNTFSAINEKLWLRYRQGFMRQDELRWKRFWRTLLEYKIADEQLARDLSATYLQLLPIQTALMPDAIEVLDYCKTRGYTMHIITNGFEETQIKKMTHSGISPYFQEIITSEKSMSLKPHKEIFEYTLNAISGTAKECLMIGDSYDADIVGAKNMSIDQVLYDPFQNGLTHDATYTIHGLMDLKDIL